MGARRRGGAGGIADRLACVARLPRLRVLEAVTGSALRDPTLSAKYRWLPAIADAVDNSIPKPRTPDEPKMEDLLGTALNQALVQAISQKSGYQQIAQTHLTAAANQITAYLKQQGTY